MDNHQYLSVQQIVQMDKYPFTEGQMRHFLLMRHKNKLYKAVHKVGKRLYLRKDLFEIWLSEQKEVKNG